MSTEGYKRRLHQLAKPFKDNWPQHKAMIKALAKHATARPNGILFAVQTEAENVVTYAGGPRALVQPEELANNAAAGTAAKYSQQMEAYAKEVQAIKEITMEIIGSLPIQAQKIACPSGEFDKVTAQQLMANLDEKWGKMLASDISKLLSKLEEPYSLDQQLDDFLTEVACMHDSLRRQGNELSDAVKIEKLMKALTPCNRFNSTYTRFQQQIRHDSTKNTYKFLVEEIEGDATMATTQTLEASGFAANITAEALGAMMDARISAAITAATSAQPPAKRARPNSKRQPRPRATPAFVPTSYTPTPADIVYYCWTHGFNSSHPSPGCRNPARGHQAAATYQDRLGGSTAMGIA